MKTCKICKQEKEDLEFPPKRRTCRKCKYIEGAEYRKKWTEKNREKIREQVHENYLKNKESVLERTRKWKLENKSKFTESWKKSNEKHPLKRAARKIFNHHVEAGKILRAEKCEDCIRLCKTEAHHEDYSRPLDVVWLCRPCHALRHRKYK